MPSTPSSTRSLLAAEFAEHLAVAGQTEAAVGAPFAKLVAASVGALQAGAKIMLFGNGGSAADAQHLATELTIRFKADRPAIAAIALTTDSSALTAAGNDLGFEHIFSRQIEALARPGDIAIGISTSGNSPNVLRALIMANALGCVAAGLAGNDGGKLRQIADPLLVVPSKITARIQEMHILIGHAWCTAIEKGLGYA